MRKVSDIEQRAVEIRTTLAGCLDEMRQMAGKYQLSSATGEIDDAQKLLKQQDFDIVVCGEVKQGKSSFINSLLGKPLLPTDVKVATSQVFRISNAERESFSLEFWNGDSAEISAEELKKYGTEPDEVMVNDPLLRGRQLRWIAINTPTAFLPPNVHLLDTPGLGAVYHAHTEITSRYISTADAVIFLKDSREPLTQTERNFINTIFGVTRNVLFVQSKADTLDQSTRGEILQRNEALLNEYFEKTAGTHLKFYSFSSRNLLMAAQQEDARRQEMLKSVSGIDEIMSALETLFFKTVYYANSCAACNRAFDLYQRNAAFIAEQRRLLEAGSQQQKKELAAAKRSREVEFLREWGSPGGQKWKAMTEDIRKITDSALAVAQRICCTGALVETKLMAEINALPDSNLNMVRLFAEKFPAMIQTEVDTQWQEIYVKTTTRLTEKFAEFQADIKPSFAEKMDLYLNLQNTLTPEVGENGRFTKLRNIAAGLSLGATAGLIAACFFGCVTLFPAVAVASAVFAKREYESMQSRAAKRDLINQLHQSLAQLNHLLFAPEEIGLKGQIPECLDQLYKASLQVCETIRDREHERLNNEAGQLEAQANMDAAESRNKLAQLSDLATEMEECRTRLLSARDQLVEIKQRLGF